MRMRRDAIHRLAVLVLLLCAAVAATSAQERQAPPALEGAVNDFANVIGPADEAAIARVSEALRQASGDVIVVATVKTIAPFADARSYAVEMFENAGRGIGEKGQDNGLLVLLALDERQVRIEVGYGLEPFITDGFAGETSREAMVPRFREGDFGGGLRAGVERLAARIAEGRDVTLPEDVVPPRPARRSPGGLPIPGFLIALILYLIISSIAGRRPRRRGWGGHWSGWSSGVGPFGGGFGGGFGGSSGGFGGGFGGFGGGRSGGGGGGASW
jgi:uncharacterized protein